MSQKKFIITKDESTANKLIASGFKLVSTVSDCWTFLNIAPKNFSFDDEVKKQVAYTNILSM